MVHDKYSRDLNRYIYKGVKREELWNAVKFMSQVVGIVAFCWMAAILYLVTF